MPECKCCHKKGLLLYVNHYGYCNDCMKRKPDMMKHVIQLKKKNEKDHQAFLKFQQAEQKLLEVNGNPYPERIKAYKSFIKTFKGEYNIGKYELMLAEIYSHNGQFKQAAGLLRDLEKECLSGKKYAARMPNIRYTQFLVYSENGMYVEAIRAQACYYVLNSRLPSTYLSKMRPMAKNGGLSLEQIDQIYALLDRYVGIGDQNESRFMKEFDRITK